jgi:hypothetical protein
VQKCTQCAEIWSPSQLIGHHFQGKFVWTWYFPALIFSFLSPSIYFVFWCWILDIEWTTWNNSFRTLVNRVNIDEEYTFFNRINTIFNRIKYRHDRWHCIVRITVINYQQNNFSVKLWWIYTPISHDEKHHALWSHREIQLLRGGLLFFSSFLFSVIVGIRVSLRALRLITRDPEVNDHVNLQWS